MDNLQIIYPYYENPVMLNKHLETWEQWGDLFKGNVKIILVDDGSTRTPALNAIYPTDVNIELYRIKENIPWNQNGAHNLGFHVADKGWCLSTDIDHVVIYSQLRKIFELKTHGNSFYSFARRQARDLGDVNYKRHPNSWLLTRDMYWEAGGYDEDFSGYYGSDSVFRRALKSVGKHKQLNTYLVVYDLEDIPDANTTEFGRKDSKYYSVNYPHLVKKRRIASKAENPLRLSWERVI